MSDPCELCQAGNPAFYSITPFSEGLCQATNIHEGHPDWLRVLTVLVLASAKLPGFQQESGHGPEGRVVPSTTLPLWRVRVGADDPRTSVVRVAVRVVRVTRGS